MEKPLHVGLYDRGRAGTCEEPGSILRTTQKLNKGVPTSIYSYAKLKTKKSSMRVGFGVLG